MYKILYLPTGEFVKNYCSKEDEIFYHKWIAVAEIERIIKKSLFDCKAGVNKKAELSCYFEIVEI